MLNKNPIFTGILCRFKIIEIIPSTKTPRKQKTAFIPKKRKENLIIFNIKKKYKKCQQPGNKIIKPNGQKV